MDMHIRINLDNAAFDPRESEIARILRDIAHKVEEGREPDKIMDVNGNTVGEITYTR